MGQSLSLSYSMADASQVGAIFAQAPVRVKQQPPRVVFDHHEDAKSSCSSFAVSDEELSDDEGIVDLPFYHDPSINSFFTEKPSPNPADDLPFHHDESISSFFAEKEETEDDDFGIGLFDDDNGFPVAIHHPAPVHDLQELAFQDADEDALDYFFNKESENFVPPRPIDPKFAADIPNLDLDQAINEVVLPDEEVVCLLCGHKWDVLAVDFNGQHQVASFDGCRVCSGLDLDQELCQNYAPLECPICMEEIGYDDVTFECGHGLHEECLRSLLQQKWTTDRINFSFLNCPCCRASMWNPSDYNHKVSQLVREYKIDAIKKTCDNLAEASIKAQAAEVFEGEEDPVAKVESMNREEKLSLAYQKLSLYMCSECDHPFFGGMANCVADMEASASSSSSGPPARKCLSCTVGKKKSVCGCPLDNLIFKCMCCCSPATYHCGGTEFYCDRCHDDLYTAYPCPGPEHCPLGIVHPANCVGTIGGGKAVTPFALFCKQCGPLGHLWDHEAGKELCGLDKN